MGCNRPIKSFIARLFIARSFIARLLIAVTALRLPYHYGTWMPTKAELTQVQRILYNPIKRILKAPMTTPT